MKIINYKGGKAVLFASGIIVVKFDTSTAYYRLYVTKFKNFKLTKSAVKTAKKSFSTGEEINFSDLLEIGLQYFKGVYEVPSYLFNSHQDAICDLVKRYVLPHVEAEQEQIIPELDKEKLTTATVSNGHHSEE
ncbi:hypothetical protein [Flammeovirga aprica]|uniref:Uncharacterized protein n=1 Tax=Flammeovirga aprica JL-4 TaxID=694437 RepID=A0A7X9RXK0_9BACT|nr:hypothetical protein [Flammeovirga aprica]NME70566.1 hypothetical protein [Flammeovirga aprica JL-4]